MRCTSRPRLALLLLVLAGFACLIPAHADIPDAANPDSRRIYIGHGQTLVVSPARQLTYGAHVTQFLYQPRSLEAACAGTQTSPDSETITSFVRLIGLKRGETTTLLSATVPNTPDALPDLYELVGWSGDGRYLIVAHAAAVRNADGTPADDPVQTWESIDVGVSPVKVRRIALTLPGETGGRGIGVIPPTPSAPLFAETWVSDAAHKTRKTFVLIYNPATDTLRRVPLPEAEVAEGWLDETHLLLGSSAGVHFSCDIATGKQTPTTLRPAVPAPPPNALPGIVLSLPEPRLAVPAPGTKHNAVAYALWLYVVAGTLAPTALNLAVNLEGDDLHPALAPNQSAALWQEHGDLYRVAFSLDRATISERYKGGDQLSCEEEREIAKSNVREIALGILQYAQDYDEHFPAPVDFQSAIRPYLKDDTLLSVGSSKFVYAPPADLSMASMDNVSELVIGTLSLPCATITLYADGHVQSHPATGKTPAP